MLSFHITIVRNSTGFRQQGRFGSIFSEQLEPSQAFAIKLEKLVAIKSKKCGYCRDTFRFFFLTDIASSVGSYKISVVWPKPVYKSVADCSRRTRHLKKKEGILQPSYDHSMIIDHLKTNKNRAFWEFIPGKIPKFRSCIKRLDQQPSQWPPYCQIN